jgi:hypothetical protein
MAADDTRTAGQLLSANRSFLALHPRDAYGQAQEPEDDARSPGSIPAGDGRPRIRSLLREGWTINHKRTRRIWRQEGLKRMARTPDIRCMEPGDAQADARTDASGLEAAFGLTPPRAPWWANNHIRLGLLLAGLMAAVLALLSIRSGLFDIGSGPAQASGAAFAPGCPGRGAPQVESIPIENLAALRNAVSRIMPPRVARVYEAGTITTSNLWSDDSPLRPSSSSSLARSVPAGYEMRWWALDREGNEDDLVADALEFATERQADDALARAASTRCRRDGAAHAGRFPSGASNLFWVNPDNAKEWDVLFVRGRRLYRIGDVPPGYPPTTGPVQSRLKRLRADTTVEVLACALPEAACQASAVSARATSLATLTASSSAQTHTSRPIAQAQARAYAHTVNLRGYDVPGMAQVAPEAPSEDRGYLGAFVRCTGELRSTQSVMAIHSPVFRYRGQLQYQSVYSTVAVFPSEGGADRYLAMLASARARTCIAHSYDRALLRRAAERKPLRLGRISATPLPSPAPASYRGLGPYRGTALRLTLQSGYTTRRGRRLQLPFYIEGFAFAYGRAVIGLTAESVIRPFAQANERYLMSKLVGRAEANKA